MNKQFLRGGDYRNAEKIASLNNDFSTGSLAFMTMPIPILLAAFLHCIIVIYGIIFSVQLYPFTAQSFGETLGLICILSALTFLFTSPNKGRWLSFSIFSLGSAGSLILASQAFSSNANASRLIYLSSVGGTYLATAFLLVRSKSVREYIENSKMDAENEIEKNGTPINTKIKVNRYRLLIFLLMLVLLPSAYRYISKPSYEFQIFDSRQPGEGEGFPNPNAPYKYVVYGDYAFRVDRFEILKRKLKERYGKYISGKKLKINQFYITEMNLRPYLTDDQGKEIPSKKPDYTQLSSVITIEVNGCLSSGTYDEDFVFGYHADKFKILNITYTVIDRLLEDMASCFRRHQNAEQ